MMLLKMLLIGIPRICFAPEGEGGAPATPSTGTSSSSASSPTPSAAPSSPSGAPSGASSTPASPAPATAPSQPGEVEGAFEPFDFGSMFGPNTGETSPTPPSPTPTPVAATGAEPAPPSPPGAAAIPVPAPASTPAPTAPESGATSPQGPQPTATQPTTAQQKALDPADPIGLANALAEQEPAVLEHIANTVFKLSPEDIEELETNTVAAVPKLLARAFVKIQQNQLIHLGRVVPQMIQRHTEMLRRNAKNEEKFYSRWPDLNAEKHGDLVRRYGATYRQMHPTATLEQMIEDLGPMVMMSAKVVPGSAAQGAPGSANPMKTAPQGNGVRPPQPSPFVPAMGGGGTPVATDPGQADSDWSWVQGRD